ncbi:hypothetical protein [Pseudonocardia sp. N23]|uniref:hypothetical protein n=1 Tax=Pseudonocardia sp. N23 TaxID=1987376 RepID=UPI00114551A9|nr:hypothetical protein [Pseudonocardia sp. N23]
MKLPWEDPEMLAAYASETHEDRRRWQRAQCLELIKLIKADQGTSKVEADRLIAQVQARLDALGPFDDES